MNPTPNIISQLMVAGPIIVMYQVGIVLIWLRNRGSHHSPKVAALIQQDAEARASRLALASNLKPFTPKEIALTPPLAMPQPLALAKPVRLPSPGQPARPANYQRPTTRPTNRRLYLDFRPSYGRMPQAQ